MLTKQTNDNTSASGAKETSILRSYGLLILVRVNTSLTFRAALAALYVTLKDAPNTHIDKNNKHSLQIAGIAAKEKNCVPYNRDKKYRYPNKKIDLAQKSR